MVDLSIVMLVSQRVTFFWTGKVDLSIAAALRKALETAATEKDQNKSLLDDQYLGIPRGDLGVNEYTTIITPISCWGS